MDIEKLQINPAEGQKHVDVVLRETDNVNELPVLEPRRLRINGTLQAPLEFLKHRAEFTGPTETQIDQAHTIVLIDRDAMSITLVTNENDVRTSQVIIGRLRLSTEYAKFHINDGYDWQPEELGQFLRMMRTYFSDKQENMQIVSSLKSFKAKVNSEYENEVKDNGNRKISYSQVVDSNIPPSFVINIPVFYGMAPQSLEVETIAHVNGTDVGLTLISVGAVSFVEEHKNTLIDNEIEFIRKEFPMLPVIEGEWRDLNNERK